MTGTVRRFYLSRPPKRRGGWVAVVLGAGILIAAPLLFLHHGGTSLVLLPWALFVPVALVAHWGFFVLRCVEISRAELSIVYALYRRKIPRERIAEWKRIKRDPVDAAYDSGPSRRSAGDEWIRQLGATEVHATAHCRDFVLVKTRDGKALLIGVTRPDEFAEAVRDLTGFEGQ